MKLTDGNLYFKKISEIKNQYPYLCKNAECEVLVIGGGISGAITAYYLAKEGLNVMIIEKNIVGYGATLAATNILEYQGNIDMCKLNKIMGEKKSKKFYELCLDSINELEKIIKDVGMDKKVGFEKKDCIYYTNKYMNKSTLLKEYGTRINSGLNVKIIEGNEILDLKYGVLLKNGSAVMNGYEFVQQMMEYLSKMDNVSIYENTEAVDIKSRDDYVDVITKNKFKIKAKRVVITEGAESIKRFSDIPVDICRTFTIVTEPVQGVEKEHFNFTAKDMESPCHNIRFTNDSRIVFSGEKIKVLDKHDDENLIKQISNAKYRKLFKTLQESMPGLGDITVKYCFNGVIVDTKDSLPIIDELPGMSNVFCNLAYGINGTLYSIIGAKMLKEINKEYYARDMHLFRLKR